MTLAAETLNLTTVTWRASEFVQRLDTPCLVIDGPTVERNIERLAAYSRRHGLGIRPHTKTHKSLKIAQLQLDHGAIGLTVAKPGEARVMAQLGAEVLIAYPSVTQASLTAIATELRESRVLVAIDSADAIELLEKAVTDGHPGVGVLIDVDIGLHRTGLQTVEQSLQLARQVERIKNLDLAGLFCYPGHIWEKPGEQHAALGNAAALLEEHLDAWRKAGLDARIVSGGSTPTAYQSHLVPCLTEIRPGTYVFNDMNTVRGGFCELEDCATRFIVTVISDAVPGQIVIDAGSKTLASDRCIPAPDSGQGFIVELPQAKITHLSEEHGQVDVSRCDHRPRVGERLTVIPNHVCPTVNLTNEAWWVAADGIIERLVIDARGMVR